MPKEMHHPQQLGNKFDGAWATTFSSVVALALIIFGALLTIYLGSVYSLIFSIPLIAFGLLLIIAVEFIIGKKSD